MNTQSTSAIRAHQEGSIVVILAIAIVMLIALLGSIQIGYTAYMKRELQKTADMVALSAVQNLQTDGCDLAKASSIAHANDKAIGALESPQMQCGTWDSKEPPGDRFKQTTEDQRAVQITLSKEAMPFLPLFSKESTVSVIATAVNTESLAAFSLGSRLLSLDPDGLIGSVLKRVGLDPELLTVLDQHGLVNARLTPSGLLAALQVIDSNIDLGASTPNDLLDLAPIKVGDLLLASARVLGNQLTNTQVDAIETIAAKLNVTDLKVKLLGDGDEHPAALLLDTTNPQAALHTAIALPELVATSILIANEGHAINIPFTGLDLGLLSVTADAYIVAPPTIAIGGVGTTAHNAQARVNLHLTEATITGLDLNLQLELAQADAEVSELTCKMKPEANEAKFDTETSLAGLCILPENPAPGYRCSDNGEVSSKIKVLDVLGIIPVSVTPRTNLLPVTTPYKTTKILYEPPPPEDAVTTLRAQPSPANLTSALVNTLLGDIVGGILPSTEESPQSIESTKQKDATRALMLKNNNNIDQVQQTLEQAEEPLQALKTDDSGFISNALKNTADGLLDVVGSLVSGLTDLLSDLLGGVLCGLGLCPEPTLESKITGLQKELFGTSPKSNQNGLATLTVSLLSPLLNPLDTVLNALLDTLGLNVAEADLKLLSVQCGLPQLVK